MVMDIFIIDNNLCRQIDHNKTCEVNVIFCQRAFIGDEYDGRPNFYE